MSSNKLEKIEIEMDELEDEILRMLYKLLTSETKGFINCNPIAAKISKYKELMERRKHLC